MSQVNWTQLTEAMVLIRSLALSGSSQELEVGHPPPCLATPWGSASQRGKKPLHPVQYPQGCCGMHSTSPWLFSGGKETQHEMWQVQTCPFGLAGAEPGARVTPALDLPS